MADAQVTDAHHYFEVAEAVLLWAGFISACLYLLWRGAN